MSPHNESVEPAAFDTADSPVAPKEQHKPLSPPPAEAPATPSWVLPALGGLVVLALIVVFWLPGRFQPEPPTLTPPEVAEAPATPGKARPEPTAEERSPFSDAQTARLRKQAQDALQSLLDLQFQLEEMQVEQWATEPYAAAVALAETGDQQYREREFETATATYNEGAAALQAILDSVPEVLEGLLQAAETALAEGDAEAATTNANTALVLSPDHPRALAALARAETLPRVLELLATAEVASSTRDYAGALAALDEAIGLDDQYQPAQDARTQAAADLARQQFNKAMTDGYLALEEDQWSSATAAFKRAAGIYPDSAEVRSALQEVATAQTTGRLRSLLQQGERAEQAELWQDAAEAYGKALGVDSSVTLAREGQQRAESRAKLDTLLQQAIDKPTRMADDKIFRATSAVVQQAKGIANPGPRLSGQLTQLDRLMQSARTPVAVTLRSDSATEVTIYKVARLGQFSERQVELRPGTYTAVGVRAGYRDVRHSITVSHDNPAPVITIACTEAI